MNTPHLRPLLAGASALLGVALLVGGCRTNVNPAMDHWNVASLGPRLQKNFLGYRADLDGNYRDFVVNQKQDVNMTLRRHFLNNNPANPFEAPDPVYMSGGRPPHSLLPNPLNYFHLEAIAIGFATYGIWDVFLPIPIFSIVASLQPGGGDEFVQGLEAPFRTGSYGQILQREPQPVKKFRVRQR